MSTSARWREAQDILGLVDPVLSSDLQAAFSNATPVEPASLPVAPLHSGSIILVGHRGAGKTTILPHIARLVSLPAVDLDAAIESHEGASIREIFRRGEAAFRTLERAAFQRVNVPSVVSVGGGFLSHHPDSLRPHLAVYIPLSSETHRARMMQDVTRPRLRPELSLEDEITSVFQERHAAHSRVPTMPLLDFLLHAVRAP